MSHEATGSRVCRICCAHATHTHTYIVYHILICSWVSICSYMCLGMFVYECIEGTRERGERVFNVRVVSANLRSINLRIIFVNVFNLVNIYFSNVKCSKRNEIFMKEKFVFRITQNYGEEELLTNSYLRKLSSDLHQ